jgi:methionine-rich copper-binding protein CopC
VPTHTLSNRSGQTSARAAVARRPVLEPRVSAALAVLLALAATLLGAAALTVATAGPAGAHDRLESSDPPAGAELTAPPGQIVLTFSADILDTGKRVVLRTPQGELQPAATVDGPQVTATLPPDLPGGLYEVVWRAVSSDGHPIEGTFGFTVAEQATPSPTPSPTPTEEPEPTPEATDATSEAGTDAGSGMPLLFGVALLAIVAVAAAVIWRTRRQLHQGYGPPGQD